jgi:hypothetical protein
MVDAYGEAPDGRRLKGWELSPDFWWVARY